MDEINEKYWQNELNCALEREKITDPNFHEFLKNKIKKLPLKVEDFGWGVFPILDDNGILIDIKMVIPIIYDIKSLCVNIHEYTHAYEMYFYLGEKYEWHISESEEKAKDAERRLLFYFK